MCRSRLGNSQFIARSAVLLVALSWLAACRQTPVPASTSPAAMPASGQVVPVTPNPPPLPPPSSAQAPAQAPATEPPSTSGAAPGGPPAATPSAVAPAKSARRKPSTPKAATVAASDAPATKQPAAPAATQAPAAPAAASARDEPRPTAPALDLASLEQRLRDTKAIGVFTKLSLKNQVDDLLDEVRQYHRNPSNPPQPVVRRQFEGLMLKVLSSLQGGDPQLANTIAASREALWGILMDPDKFSKI